VSADALYRPYAPVPASSLRCLFRDHGLSDAIGFLYQSWDGTAAADDFLHRVRDAGRRFRAALPSGADESPIVTVILDGENAWEHYAGGGRPFLRALYRRLSDALDIETVTVADAVRSPDARALETIFPGSWINGDFYIWAGHADDHRAWGQLARARAAYDLAADGAEAQRLRAYEELLIAEGSDWFWWYGDDHSSDQDRDFDDLFRRHLRNVYTALGVPAPDDLFVSNISTEPHAGPVRFRELASPVIDGRVTNFGEWSRSAIVGLDGAGGTMHRVSCRLIRELHLAVDETFLYLRLDGSELVRRLQAGGLELALVVAELDAERRLELARQAHWQADEVVEIAVRFDAIGVQPGRRIRLSVLVTEGAQTLERQPAAGPIDLEIPGRDLTAINWVV
jgi:alpha-amylase/alpha-mannosidase (GH57 family)